MRQWKRWDDAISSVAQSQDGKLYVFVFPLFMYAH